MAVVFSNLESNEEPKEPTIDVTDEISKYVFASKYARYDHKLQRRETWNEAIDRVQGMHLKKFKGDKLTPAQRAKIRWAFDLVREKRVLPSMRSLQFGGTAVEAHNARQFNCSVRHVDSVRAFAEVFYLLLCGCGVGLGLTKKHISRIPRLVDASDRTGTVITYVVEDSIEGWADSVETLLLCYTRSNPFSGRKVVFDYSKIRPQGSLLKTGGGRAPGYLPLKIAHSQIKNLLEDRIETKRQVYLEPIDVYDILMYAADAVISGGVRRSATIVIFDKDDEKMLHAKTGDWFNENPQRGRSNNSVLLLRNEVSFEEFCHIIERTRQWGEPGFIFADHEDTLFNPCAEIGFIPITQDGRSGVQFCNLTSINYAKITNETELLEAAEAAAIIGTLQATYTTFPYLSSAAKELTEEEALLGVSMTAMMENPTMAFDNTLQRKAANKVVETNAKWSQIFGINRAARNTCIKPEGCLAPNTLVSTDKGILQLSELGELSGGNFRVSTDTGDAEAGGFYVNGHAETRKLRFQSGLILEATLQHKFRVLTEDLKYEWKTVANLLPGDEVIYILGDYQGSSYVEFEQFTPTRNKYASSQKTIKQPEKLEEDLAWFLGLYLADGSNHSRGIRISGDDRKLEHLERAEGIIRNIFGLDAKVHKPQKDLANDHRIQYYWNSLELLQWLDVHNLKKDKSPKVSIPKLIRQSPPSVIQSYFNGLVAGDGCIPTSGRGRHTRRYSTTSPQLVQELISVGRAVGLDIKMSTVNPTSSSFTGGVRYQGWERWGSESQKLFKKNRAKYSVLRSLGIERGGFDKLVEKTESDSFTVDLIVPGPNTYLAGGVVSHNTGSLAVGTMASGIHAAQDHWMFRRVQANKMDPVYKFFKQTNSHMCEESVWSTNKTDDVITFPVRVSDSAMVKNDLDALSHLSMIKSTQENWVLSGSVSTKRPVTHNVSCTVRVNEDEWDTVTNYLYLNRNFFGAVSLIPSDGDKRYAQAPVESVINGEDFEKFQFLLENMSPVDYTELTETDDVTERQNEIACGGGACEI